MKTHQSKRAEQLLHRANRLQFGGRPEAARRAMNLLYALLRAQSN